MADVFMSYAREDRPVAEAIAKILEQSGWSVWWDRHLQPQGGATFDELIDQEIESSRCVLVLWSRASIGSPWVKAEAMEAINCQKLVQATLEDVRLPLVFRSYHYASLARWNKEPSSGDFAAIQDAIAHFAARGLLLSVEEAQALIWQLAQQRKVEVQAVEAAPASAFGTVSYRARSKDGRGVIYCHATGKLRGKAFYVRKGIGYYFEYELGASGSPLGLPVSNEELVDGKGFPTTYFEGGYIEWSPETGVARAVVQTEQGETVLGEKRL
jgi:hypothetical protein